MNEFEEKLRAVEGRLKQLEDIVERHNNYFTISAYASIRGLDVNIDDAYELYQKAIGLSREYGYEILKARDAQFRKVNAYHVDILKEVFKRQ